MGKTKKKATLKTTPQNGIVEEGTVRLTIVQGKRVISKQQLHNAATLTLFQGLLICLSGVPDQNKLPQFISAGKGAYVGDSSNLTGLIEEVSSVRNRLTSNFGSPVLVRTSSTSYYKSVCKGAISYLDVSGEPIKELGLFGTEATATLLARTQLATEVQLEPGQTLLVEWEITLQNKIV